MEEYIICSAIHFDDGEEHVHQPKNIKTGFVISGRRHHNCYSTLQNVGKSLGQEGRVNMAIKSIDRDCQGFITNTDRFVNRKEGYLIARDAKQLLHDMHDKSNPILISEDLY